MTFVDEFEAIVHDMCVDVISEAITEISAGDRKQLLPLKGPEPANKTEMFPSKWRKFLGPSKSCYEVSTIHIRDVSLTKSWQECSPELEDLELRRKHQERVNLWRNLLFTNKNETYFPGVFKYKATNSLLDHILPIMKMNSKLDDIFEIVDLKDIIPKIVIDPCEDVVEVTSKVLWEDKSDNPLGVSKNRQRRNRFLCCFQR